MSIREPSWRPAFFPSGQWNAVSLLEIRETLRDWFVAWGLPEAFRVDNGWPWGSKGDLPTDLALWLIGLNVRVCWNPPRQPQKNGVVERSQGTGKRWSEPGRCQSVDELQKRIDEMDAIQRSEYPLPDGRSRMELYPELRHSGRSYARRRECVHWNWDLVADHLAQYVTSRQVDSRGQVTIYKRNRYVGQAYAGQIIQSSFDPSTCEWIFRDLAGNQLRCQTAQELTQNNILHLNVTKRRGQT